MSNLFKRILLLLTFFKIGLSSLTTEKVERIDNFVEKALGCRNLPGLSLSVVQNEQPVLVKGYGWANVDQRTPATNKTLFCIASVTKHFTAAALGTLMTPNNQNGTTFKTKVKAILGDEFQLSDKDRESKVSIGDLLSHRTGMGRAALPYWFGGYNRTELFRRLRFVPPIREFREEFQYNNIMYAVAGKVAEKLQGGKPYEDIVIENLFKPLGMTDATFLARDPARWSRDFAQPYHMVENSTVVQSMEALRPGAELTGPAGAVCLHSEDMAKWQQFLLAKGKSPNGQAVLEESVFNDIVRDWMHVQNSPSRRPLAIRPKDPFTLSRDTYGLGLYNGYYRGYRIYSHAGFKFGFTSELMVFPDLNISISTAINAFEGGASAVHGLAHRFIADILLGLSPWMNESSICPNDMRRVQEPPPENSFLNQFDAMFPLETTAEKGRTRFSTMRPLREYVGSYGSYVFGRLKLSIVNITGVSEALRGTYGTIGDVIFVQSGQRDILLGWGQNVTRYINRIPIQFSVNSTDNVVSMTVPIDPDWPPTFFKDLDSDTLPDPPTPPPPVTCPPIRNGAQTHELLEKSVLVVFIMTIMVLL